MKPTAREVLTFVAVLATANLVGVILLGLLLPEDVVSAVLRNHLTLFILTNAAISYTVADAITDWIIKPKEDQES